MMQELSWIKENQLFIESVLISDDSFLVRDTQNIEEFCEEYINKIRLPFACLGSPLDVTEEKLSLLVDAGMRHLTIGVQSGSPRIQELYKRKQMSNERTLRAMRSIHKYKDRLLPFYDFILDMPYETQADKIETINFIAKIPKPFRLKAFSCIFHLGTELYKMAEADNLVYDEKSQIYSKVYRMRELNYFNVLILLARNGKFPSLLLRLLATPAAVAVFNNKVTNILFRVLFRFRQAIRTLRRRFLHGRRKKL